MTRRLWCCGLALLAGLANPADAGEQRHLPSPAPSPAGGRWTAPPIPEASEAADFKTAQPSLLAAQGTCNDGVGGTLISGGTAYWARMEPGNPYAGYKSYVYWDGGRKPILIGNSQDSKNIPYGSGTPVCIPTIPKGEEVVFKIEVQDTGQEYFTGTGSRNYDGQPYESLVCFLGASLGGGTFSFEDGADRSLNDVRFSVFQDPLRLSMTPTLPTIIPTGEKVDTQNRILTRSLLTLGLSAQCVPLKGQRIKLASDRQRLDAIIQPQATDVSGKSTASVETRANSEQAAKSTITAIAPSDVLADPTVIPWLPAQYESKFRVTCYYTVDEGDYPGDPVESPACGVVGPFRAGFLAAVQYQGSGKTRWGGFVQYNSKTGCYHETSCAITSGQTCADTTTTIAIDRDLKGRPRDQYIPFKSTVDVGVYGTRRAEDTGGDVTGYQIDLYQGTGKAVCSNWPNSLEPVTLKSY